MPFVALLIPREMCVSSIRFARRFITFALSFLGFGNCMLLCAVVLLTAVADAEAAGASTLVVLVLCKVRFIWSFEFGFN